MPPAASVMPLQQAAPTPRLYPCDSLHAIQVSQEHEYAAFLTVALLFRICQEPNDEIGPLTAY